MAICFADSIFLYNFAPNKEQNPAKRAGRGAWTGVQAEITPVEPDADNAAVGTVNAIFLLAAFRTSAVLSVHDENVKHTEQGDITIEEIWKN